MEKVTLKVGGMSCEHCVKAVADAISGIAGTKDVVVNLKAGSASFNYDPAKASLDAIKAAITEEEFSVS